MEQSDSLDFKEKTEEHILKGISYTKISEKELLSHPMVQYLKGQTNTVFLTKKDRDFLTTPIRGRAEYLGNNEYACPLQLWDEYPGFEDFVSERTEFLITHYPFIKLENIVSHLRKIDRDEDGKLPGFRPWSEENPYQYPPQPAQSESREATWVTEPTEDPLMKLALELDEWHKQ